MTAGADGSGLERVLAFVRDHRGFDFTGYKRPTLQRRVGKRMQELGVDDYDAYIDVLEAAPEEYPELFNTILINVSAFFRDPAVWTYVAEHIVPALIERTSDGRPIRVWSAGCSSGEEPYTIAMLLAEALGTDGLGERIKVFATDVDEEALAEARQAVYPRARVEGVPAALRERYFEDSGDQLAIAKDLRRTVIFGRNDLVRDAPISRIDLLVCRNTLIYFNADTQRNIMDRLHLALADDGFLVLGKSELLLTNGDGFAPERLGQRIFHRVSRTRPRAVVPAPAPAAGAARQPAIGPAVVRSFARSPVAQLVLDADGVVVLGNERLRELFGVGDGAVGKRLQDLELSYRPVELRSLIERATGRGEPVRSGPFVWPARDGGERHLEVEVAALHNEGSLVGTSVAFIDVTRHARVTEELESSKGELEQAYKDVQSTVEELETTNEELQSSNEELETMNEELQSTNEELETMNEELQSSNEELETMNEELRSRTDELNRVNTLVESMLASLGMGVAVLDRDLRVTMWNEDAKNLWGVDLADVRDSHFLNLDIGLPVHELRAPLRAAQQGAATRDEQHLPARDRRGRDLVCGVQCWPLLSASGAVTGVIVLMRPDLAGDSLPGPAGGGSEQVSGA